jgi:cytochrome oxidase Cu insertion factor (SCO1/SenC/PrrC family)
MRRLAVALALALGLGLSYPATLSGQDPSDFLAVGEMAPDIEVAGATRYGVLAAPVNLSDLKGETVVLAFFFKVRTGG